MTEEKRRDWREVAEAAANETNSEKLHTLARELVAALEKRDNCPLAIYKAHLEVSRLVDAYCLSMTKKVFA